MISPTVVAVLGVMGYPWLYSLWLSLHSVNLLTKRWVWVGLENYTKSFHDDTFTSSLLRTLWFSGLVVIGGTLVGLLMALVLNEAFRGRGVIRSVMLMPWAIRRRERDSLYPESHQLDACIHLFCFLKSRSTGSAGPCR